MKNKALFALLFSSVLLTGCMDTNSEGATEDTTAVSSQESSTSLDSTTDSSEADEEVEEESEEKNLNDSELFDLSDSMYDKKEDDE